MRTSIAVFLLSAALLAQNPGLPADDAVRIQEFYRLAAQVQDKVWPNWSQTPAPLLLVTTRTEFLTHHPSPTKDFAKIGDDFFARPRQFSTNLLATFPAFGPPSVIVIGEPANTTSKTSTPWLIALTHEHFHQLQYAQHGYFQAVEDLGLSHGDKTGVWMLNYPFPYEKQELVQGFARLRDRLLGTLHEADRDKFAELVEQYVTERKKFIAQLTPEDQKYLSFQLWQEGIARYTEIKVAEAAAQYQPSPEYAALPDYEPFSAYAARARSETLEELRQINLAKSKRTVVYSFGAAEGFLLDRINPTWKDEYFKHPLSMDSMFEK